tara:strand:+ start:638 stop:739 length:102 start_codon:yes stop_codon:yes gene_type:complete
MVGAGADDLANPFASIAEAMWNFGIKVVCLARF